MWNEEGVALYIKITPPFWRTIWFRLLGIVMIFGFIIIGTQFRTARILRQNRELEQRVLERTAQLEETNRELEAFTYSVSHDLRAPLRGMDGFSQILLEDYGDKVDDKGKDYLKRIQKASHRMGLLIDDLLRLFRLARSEMEFTEVNLSQLFKSVVDEYRQMDPKRRVTTKIAKNIRVVGDESLFRVMFHNLVDNAWKFTKDQKEARIEFGTQNQDGKTVYFIKDNGVGFDMVHSKKLFEAFQRQHTGFEGTGVGLATVKRIILRHGGRIWAEGRENEGATFYFTLEKMV